MGDQDPRAQYRVLPSAADSDDTVIEVETRQADVEQRGHTDPEGAETPVRLVIW